MPRPFVFLVYVMSLLNYPVESLYDVFFLCQISWKAAATSILAASSSGRLRERYGAVLLP